MPPELPSRDARGGLALRFDFSGLSHGKHHVVSHGR